MLRKTVVVCMLAILVLPMVSVYAEESENALTKLGRGLANGVTGIVEVPKQIYLVSKEREPITGITYGTAKGICLGLMRTGAGVYDTLTFPIPPYNKPLMDPEFVFDGWQTEK